MSGWNRVFIIAVIGVGLLVPPAMGQGRHCYEWTKLRDRLADRNDQRPIGGGVINERTMVAVLSAPEGKSFMIVIINQNGMACPVVQGSDWNPGSLPVPETES